jgi:hypothetical protein
MLNLAKHIVPNDFVWVSVHAVSDYQQQTTLGVLVFGAEFQGPPEDVSSFHFSCPMMAASRRRRQATVSDDTFVEGTMVFVSNDDGTTFSTGVPYTLFDSTCQEPVTSYYELKVCIHNKISIL